jgi:hypothetical protein
MPTRKIRPTASSAPAREQILELVGDIDDATVMAILKTGASSVEIEEAARWAAGEAVAAVERHPLSAAASAVYDILITDPTFNPPNRDR